jgi:hypothetical protein
MNEVVSDRCAVPGCGRRKTHSHRGPVDPVQLVKSQVDSARARGKSVLLVELGDAKFIPKWELVEQPGGDNEVDQRRPVSLLFVSEEILRKLQPLVAHDPRVKFFAKFMRGGGPRRPTPPPAGGRISQRVA